MKARRVYIWTLVIFGIFLLNDPAYAKFQQPETAEPHPFFLFFEIEGLSSDPDSIFQKQLGTHLKKLERISKRQPNQTLFLRQIFYKTHRKFLRNYDPSATLPNTFDTGTYGCLSGTALYALILQHFDFDYNILETPSHVYICVHLKKREVLIESTLPIEGFISGHEKIKAATQQYAGESRKTTSLVAISSAGIDTTTHEYGKEIDLKQLSGLQYYNMSIFDMARDDLDGAMTNAEKSLDLYPSKRTEKLMEIVINKILQSKSLTNDQKAGILNTYISQVKKKRLTKR